MYIDNNLQQIYPSTWVWEGVQYPQAIFTMWSNAELATVGIYRTTVDDIPTPQGKCVAGYTFRIEGDEGYATPIFEDVPVVVPFEVTKAQGKASLLVYGILDDALTYIATLDGTERTLAEIAFNDTTHWQRDSEVLQNFTDYLGLSSTDVDNLFITAADIKL